MDLIAPRMVAHDIDPRMAAATVARAILTRRHRDGLAADFVRRTGGRVRELPGNLFSDDGDDQPCVNPCPCECRLFGRELVETGQAFKSLEGELDLPTKAIEGEEIGRRESIDGQRGQQKNVVGGL